MAMWRHVACRISKATRKRAHARASARTSTHPYTRSREHTHALNHTNIHTQKHVILIAFPRQQWFRERTLLRVTLYVHCLYCLCIRCKLQTSNSPAQGIEV